MILFSVLLFDWYLCVNSHIYSLKSPQKTTSLQTNSFGSTLLSSVLNTSLRYPIIGIARNTMVKSAENYGVDWYGIANKMEESCDWKKEVESITSENNIITEDYYKVRFHGYDDGNLCMKSAIEQELAGKAVGIRNFPSFGLDGEEEFRKTFDREILLHVSPILLNTQGTVVDLGCGTGTSTRRLAKLFPFAQKIIGIDLSPHMIAVGRYLLKEPLNWWIEKIIPDDRISLKYGDIANTGLNDESVDFASISLVLHECPQDAIKKILREAARIVKPGGVLAIFEMDPQSPGYRKLRQNSLLYSVIRSTEPHLDEYFDFAPSIPSLLESYGFPVVKISAATGRHFCIVGYKGGNIDHRPSDEEREKIDTHIKNVFKTKV
jgi:ubiquinone/menaquinone biosynthesis C-methylase UbiE